MTLNYAMISAVEIAQNPICAIRRICWKEGQFVFFDADLGTTHPFLYYDVNGVLDWNRAIYKPTTEDILADDWIVHFLKP